MKIPPVEAELFYADGLSGRPDYIFTVVLREFAKAPKNKTVTDLRCPASRCQPLT